MDWGQYNWPKSPILLLSLTFMIVKGLFANASISLTTICVVYVHILSSMQYFSIVLFRSRLDLGILFEF